MLVDRIFEELLVVLVGVVLKIFLMIELELVLVGLREIVVGGFFTNLDFF